MAISIEAVIQRLIEHDEHGLPEPMVVALKRAGDSVEARMTALVAHGDAEAIPLIHWLMELIEVGEEPAANLELFEVARALKSLGGEFTPDEARKIRRAQEVASRIPGVTGTEPLPAGGPVLGENGKAPGRNDPCWCGSGKKYKKCHQRTDEDAL